MRHHLEGAARYATEVTDVPVINAGDGAHQHPSTDDARPLPIYKTQGRIDDLTITLVGDLKYGRTVHSLLEAMQYFNPDIQFCGMQGAADAPRIPSVLHRQGDTLQREHRLLQGDNRWHKGGGARFEMEIYTSEALC